WQDSRRTAGRKMDKVNLKSQVSASFRRCSPGIATRAFKSHPPLQDDDDRRDNPFDDDLQTLPVPSSFALAGVSASLGGGREPPGTVAGEFTEMVSHLYHFAQCKNNVLSCTKVQFALAFALRASRRVGAWADNARIWFLRIQLSRHSFLISL